MLKVTQNKLEATIDTLAEIQHKRGFHPTWIVKHISSLSVQLSQVEWNYLAHKAGYDREWAKQQHQIQCLKDPNCK
jgi:hypothetical protein